ncbi:MAG: histidinol dehydrogenase [Candidatus Ancillula sp.]|jgi:histidinol dehydrogenase|nr:histidinol dehydrogenase [Candidatus Ancillula sp.]
MSFIDIFVRDFSKQSFEGVSTFDITKLLPRATFDITSAIEKVQPMLDKVKTDGEKALWEFAKAFDDVDQNPQNGGSGTKVPNSALKQAYDELDKDVRSALEVAKARIEKVHRDQMPSEHVTEVDEGAKVSQRWLPVKRVGLYVPGGLAVYPSSVLMNVIPAKIAGVKSIMVATPAQKEFGGLPHPTILAACYMLGVEEVVAAGGAGAVALMAYGVEGIDPVDVITGPGNIYVAAAKQLVQGVVGIDAVAGPTEVGIIASRAANPKYVAADMISQAEHDPFAASVLFTDSPWLIEEVKRELNLQAERTKHSVRVQEALNGVQSALILTKDLADAIRLANAYGAEHLEIHTENPEATARAIDNAGAIFVGSYSPVPLGDYIGGSNHVLPTGGTSRFSSGLSVFAFLRSVQQIEYSKEALLSVAKDLNALAEDENLPAHGMGVLARFE